MSASPLLCKWDGEVFRPRHPRVADRHFVVDQDYSLVEHEDRSMLSHRHEFAWLHEAWKNLPEDLANEYPSSEHLRKAALIEAGFYLQTMVDAGSNAAALRVAAFIKAEDEFAVAVVRGPIVIKRVAESQSKRAMGNERFQKSKTSILEIVSAMIGISPDALSTHVRAA